MSAPVLELLPAVDISEGYAVRPVGGTLSGGEQRLDPVEAALTWVKAGSRWIHLVDLDLAFGRGTNTEVLSGGCRRPCRECPRLRSGSYSGQRRCA